MINNDGTCTTCPPYTVLLPSMRECGETTCERNDIIDIDGSCKTCLRPYRPSLPDRKACIDEPCPAQMKYNYDGSCIECHDGTIVSKD